MRRVVITGMGVIAAPGRDPGSFFASLIAGRPPIRRIEQFDPATLNVQIAAEVPNHRPADHLPPRRLEIIDRFTEFALIAAAQAMKSSGLEPREDERERFGVVTGTALGGVHTQDAGYLNLYAHGATKLHPFSIPRIMHNAATSHICMEHGARGPSLAVSTACSSANHAIGDAFHLIRHDLADVMLAGGSDAPITYGVMRCWEAMRVLAQANADPPRACRPFSADREGFVLGEGSAMLVLEELEHARRRGADILAEMAGYGLSSDAGHITQPSVDGAARAVRMALREARLAPGDIGYVNAHGTGTRLNDATETQVIKEVFGAHAPHLPISSTKAMHGHAMGATGAIELVATVMAMRQGVLPPTANLDSPDPECDLDYVPNVAREQPVRAAISNSFAFGGLNAVLLVRRFEP